MLAGGDDDALRRYREALGDGDGARITVIRADGVVLADSRHDPDTMDDHASRPEVVQARATGYGRPSASATRCRRACSTWRTG